MFLLKYLKFSFNLKSFSPLLFATRDVAQAVPRFVKSWQNERLFYWLALAFGFGCLLYFQWPDEPRQLTSILLVVTFSVAYWLVNDGAWRPVLLLALMASLGFVWSQIRTTDLDHVLLKRVMAETQLTGHVRTAEKRLRGSQFMVEVIDVKGLAQKHTPKHIRLYGKQADVAHLKPACHVVLQARLIPLSKALIPNGYDARFAAHFRQEGARGFIRQIEQVTCPDQPSFAARLQHWRLRLAAHIEDKTSPEARGIAIALVTGLRGQIPPAHRESLRASGLAHMLAISGMHMVLMTGSVFGFFRLLAACFPRLNQFYDVRMACALMAVLAGFGYLLISGNNIATQRAFIMMSLVFLALMLGRHALTLRNVAIATFIVLALAPESVVLVSFQMSFAAVLALVAFYERFGRNYWAAPVTVRLSRFAYWRRRTWLYFITLLLTSIIAGAATGYIGAYHFNMLPIHALQANLLAMPIFALVIMPMALLALVLSLFHLEDLAFALMSWGIEMVVAVSDYLSNQGEAVIYIAQSPPSALALFTIGLLSLCLLTQKWRLLGLVPLLISFWLLGRADLPDIVVYGYGQHVAARQTNGEYRVLSRSPNQYVVENWLKYFGMRPEPDNYTEKCVTGLCVMESAVGTIILIADKTRLTEACSRGQVVVVTFRLTAQDKSQLKQCAPKIFDRRIWRYEAGRGLYYRPNENPSWHIDTSRQRNRLWLY